MHEPFVLALCEAGGKHITRDEMNRRASESTSLISISLRVQRREHLQHSLQCEPLCLLSIRKFYPLLLLLHSFLHTRSLCLSLFFPLLSLGHFFRVIAMNARHTVKDTLPMQKQNWIWLAKKIQTISHNATLSLTDRFSSFNTTTLTPLDTDVTIKPIHYIDSFHFVHCGGSGKGGPAM